MLKFKKTSNSACLIKILKNNFKIKPNFFVSQTRSENLSRTLKSSFFTISAFIMFLCVLLATLPRNLLVNYLGKEIAKQIEENIVIIYKY